MAERLLPACACPSSDAHRCIVTRFGCDCGDPSERCCCMCHDDAGACPDCDGDGGDKWNDYTLPCPSCGGTGRLEA